MVKAVKKTAGAKKQQPAKKAAAKANNDDFVMTISDTEENVPDMDEDEEDEEETKQEKKKGKKSKKQKEGEEETDIKPGFAFALEDGDQSNGFDGWSFDVGNGDGDQKKDIDLDDIIRRKGGLENAEVGGLNEEESDKEEEDEEDEEDEDDLAMDGFGMGVEEGSDDEDSDEEEEEDQDKEKEIDREEDEDDDEEQENQDTAEEMAKFYAPQDEADTAKNAVHKDFNNLSLSRPVLRGVGELGYTLPTPVQSSVIPIALLGKDIVAGAVTGSGKTAAYIIPVLERLVYRPKNVASTRVLVITPTRELAVQVCDAGRKLAKYVGGIRFDLAVGGLSLRAQEQQLKARPDVVVATPGRLIDHIRNSPSFQVDSIEILIVDEADRMLEEGFEKELNEILSLIPAKRQTMLFSATMNNNIKDLIKLSLKRPVRIMLNQPKQAAGNLIQEFVRIRKREQLKPALLYYLLKKFDSQQRIMIFVSKKDTAHRLRIVLGLLGLRVGELHGSRTQEQRLKAVEEFKTLETSVLVCTDVAARGIDIPKVEVVINYQLPEKHETYVHRIGRTARAGRSGRAISFVGEVTADRKVFKEAVKTSDPKTNKVVGREVKWDAVQQINATVEVKQETVDEILKEEKTEKQLLQAERDVQKGQNMIKYREEIMSRPKRTWFENEKDKKSESQLKQEKRNQAATNKKRKLDKERDLGARSYKKTAKDRVDSKRPKPPKAKAKAGKKSKN